MKIYTINPFTPNFNGKRQDRKTVEQLKRDNQYSLNVINQRRISEAIDKVAQEGTESSTEFLVDVAENLKYRTNIDLGKSSFNDWQVKLNDATKKSLSNLSKETQERVLSRLENISAKKALTDEEKQILELRSSILSQIDTDQLAKIKNKNIKQLERNLDYFIISSETSTPQKLYIMKRLNHFISPEYKINPQLENRKTQALAEIINDIVVDTPESEIPNIKAVNQQKHGMCAAISICRKALAYEDKSNFVDIIMSELDNTPNVMIYDISKLGSKTKIPVQKTYIDFDYALSNGYRIIDTSALYWMHIADTAGEGNEFVGMYSAFDKLDFDTFHDSHLMPNLKDSKLVPKQDYYRTLLKTEETIKSYKKRVELEKQQQLNKFQNSSNNIETLRNLNVNLKNFIKEIAKDEDHKKIQQISRDLFKLEVSSLSKVKNVEGYLKNFVYLPNESDEAKIEKIKAFLSVSLTNKDSAKLNEMAPNILEIITLINGLTNTSSSSYEARKFNRAQDLYNIAATYRAQYLYGLEDPQILEDTVISCNILDRESLILKNMDMLVKKLEKGTLNNTIRETLAKNLGTENETEILIEALKTNKESLAYITTELLDSCYQAIMCENRFKTLANDLLIVIDKIKANDPIALDVFATNMHVKADKREILNTLDRYVKTLQSKDCTEQQYITILNSVGQKNQMEYFKEKFVQLNEELRKDPPDEDLINGFKALHGLPEDASVESLNSVLAIIASNFNQISQVTTTFQNVLEVRDANDNILNTVMQKPLVIKKLENLGEIVPRKDLTLFQDRFAKINDYRTNHNGQEIALKDLPKELITYSKYEENLLDDIEGKVNSWYAITKRKLRGQYKELQNELNELHREVGVKTGDKYVSEGHSGLSSTQQVRIFESMTDRPYYTETNGRLAIEKLKNSPHSGITGTSVDHRRAAFHAQYVADIKKVPIKTDNGIVEKEALFHDNSWGPIEHRNTWTDETGLVRTDYERNYGGKLGYITDDKYRNGKLVENLVGEVGKVSIDGQDAYKYSMLTDIIIPGRSPSAASMVMKIRENTLVNPIIDFKRFEQEASKMTREEIQQVIDKTSLLGKNVYKEYTKIIKQIEGNPPFDKGIRTKEDYEKLPDTSNLKILIEKIAILRSYSQLNDYDMFYKKSTISDLNKTKEFIRKDARKNFEYAFGKNPEVTRYATESVRKPITDVLNLFAKENGIKLTEKQVTDIINSLKTINKDEFNGSMNKTIELMVDSFRQALDVKLPQINNRDEKIDNLANQVRENLRTNLGFTLANLNSSSSARRLPNNIINWIDNVISPSTDEEFVQIFKELQNMTTKEFYEKYGSKIDDAALNIKPVSGFDVVTQLKKSDDKTENLLFNMIYLQEFENNIKLGKPKQVYDYNQFGKVLRGAYYEKNSRTFDDIYMDYYFSLLSLNIHKYYYEPYRQQIFEKYGTYLGYTKIDTEDSEEVDKMIQTLYNEIYDANEEIESYKEKDKSILLVEKAKKYVDKANGSQIPTEKQRKYIEKQIIEFLEICEGDDTIPRTIKAAHDILSVNENATFSQYKQLIDTMYDEIEPFSKTLDGMTMKDSIKSNIDLINKKKVEFVMNVFAPKHQSRAYELLDKFIKAKAKHDESADELYADFEAYTRKYRIVLKPEQMLNEYMLLLAKPTKYSKLKTYSKLEQEQINDAKYVYGNNVKGLLMMSNILEMQNILMDCAKEGNLNIVKEEFKNSQIELRDGRIVTLDSNEGLSILIMPMLANMDLDTAIMFIEQLGLGERVIDMYSKDAGIVKMRKNIKRIDSIFTSLNKQMKIMKEELAKLDDIDNDPNYVDSINEVRENIKNRYRKTNYRKTVKLVDTAFDKILQEIKEHPTYSKTALISLYTDYLRTGSMYIAKVDVEKLNSVLKAHQQIIDLIRRLKLGVNSPAIKKREEYLEKIAEVENFAKNHTRRYDELDMHTGASDTI